MQKIICSDELKCAVMKGRFCSDDSGRMKSHTYLKVES